MGLQVRFTRWSITLGALVLLAATSALAQQQQFAANSLIIPMQSSFQSPCGVFSSYGLAWRILKENAPGGYFTRAGNHPVIVYEIINPSKNSHNRCVPTNLNTPPSLPNDPRWNDGCEFSITTSAFGVPPVVPVPSGGGAPVLPGSGQFPFSAPNMYSPTTALAKPAYPVPGGLSTAAFTTISYLGAPFVIDASDVPEFFQWISDNWGDATLNRFFKQVSGNETLCSNYNTITDYASGGSRITENYHFVNIHQATTMFSAPVARRLNQAPPKIAVVHALDTLGSAGIVQSYLDEYLKQAGMFFNGTAGHQDSAGCPVDSNQPGCTLNGSTASTKYPGLIYDTFTANTDFVAMKHQGRSYPYGLVNATDATGNLLYPVLWAPHWEMANGALATTVNAAGDIPYTGGAQPIIDNVMANLAQYSSNKGTGMLSECASIESYENDSTIPIRFDTDGGINNNGIGIPNGGYDLQNCTDPDYSSGSCGNFPNASNSFGQIGDYHYRGMAGHTQDWSPKKGLLSPPAAFPLITSVSGGVTYEFVDFGYYHGDNTKASVVYLGGHDYSGLYALTLPTPGDAPTKLLQPGGIRIALNTLINLGFQEISSERGIAAPTGYVDPNQIGDTDAGLPLVLAGTYNAVLSAPPNAGTYFDPAKDGSGGKNWLFPFNEGHLRQHPLTGGSALAVNTDNNAFAGSTTWDADAQMPLPARRNLFTYLGGQFATTNAVVIPGTATPVIGNRNTQYNNGVLQGGWMPETIDATVLTPACGGTPACLNIVSYGSGTAGQDFNIVAGADNFCDLQQVMDFSDFNGGNDFGGNCNAHNAKQLTQDYYSMGEMLQRIRGYCYARNPVTGLPKFQPADAECDTGALDFSNRAHLGGIVHSTAAIVGPSASIPDAPAGSHRPTVAYVGALDGQIHAIYVSGGAGYTGPSNSTHVPNTSPADPSPAGPFGPSGSTPCTAYPLTKFPNNYACAAFPASVTPGTELWSFMPATQLQQANSNSAHVDSSPSVMDVNVDLTGTGIREWHTVLVASTGKSNGEVFALDVTNPLKPSLLWDLHGVYTRGGYSHTVGFSPIPLANGSDYGSDQGLTSSLSWDQENTNFVLATSPVSPGLSLDVPYDFSTLGGTSDVSIGQIRSGIEPIYVAFVNTNSGTGTRGLVTFAIDIATGQKIWEWFETYGTPAFTFPSAMADNGFPGPASLLQTQNGVERVYVGDVQGRLWELNAQTGQNWNTFPGAATCNPSSQTCSAPAFDVGSTNAVREPITTNIAIAKVPATTTAGTDFAGFENSRILIFGTAGSDTLVQPNAPGFVHFLLMDDQFRVPILTGSGTPLPGIAFPPRNPLTWAKSHQTSAPYGGALLEVPNLPIVYNPVGPLAEHVYGGIVVSGQSVFYQTALGTVPTDINVLSDTVAGRGYTVNLGAANSGTPFTPLIGTFARFGGTAVVHAPMAGGGSKDFIVSNEVGKISNTAITNAGSTGVASPNSALNVQGGFLYSLRAWLSRLF